MASAHPRIVSLVPSLTELLFSLDLGDHVVGRTGFCIHPRGSVDSIPRVGGTKQANLARIRELKPTHLVVNREENPKALVDELASFIPNLVVTSPVTIQDNLDLYRRFGELFDRSAQAQALVSDFESARTQLLRRNFAPVRVLYLIWRDPWMSVTSDTFISQMLMQANMITVPDTSGIQQPTDAMRYPQMPADGFAIAGADVVLLSSEPYRFGTEHFNEIQSLPGMSATGCELIDGEMTSWYGSRAIAGLRYLERFRGELDQRIARAHP